MAHFCLLVTKQVSSLLCSTKPPQTQGRKAASIIIIPVSVGGLVKLTWWELCCKLCVSLGLASRCVLGSGLLPGWPSWAPREEGEGNLGKLLMPMAEVQEGERKQVMPFKA